MHLCSLHSKESTFKEARDEGEALAAYVKSICRGFRAVIGIEGPCSLKKEKKSGMMSLGSLNSIVRAIRLLFLSVLPFFLKLDFSSKSCSVRLGGSQISRNLIPGRRSINNNNILIPCAPGVIYTCY